MRKQRTVKSMKHYYRPGREDSWQAIAKAMPKIRGEGDANPAKEQTRQLIEGMSAKTWRQDKPRLLELLDRI